MSAEFCWNCAHPVSMHADERGCIEGLYAASTSILSFTGCSCALEPADAVEASQP